MHGARIVWTAAGDVAKGQYSRAHLWQFDGGAVVPASASPAIVPLPFSNPEGVDPEEAYLASLSSCHMLWFLDLARRAGFFARAYIDDAVGEMARDGGKLWISRVVLSPRVTWEGAPEAAPDRAAEAALHHRAHEECFIANSVRTEVVIHLEGEDDRNAD